MLCQNALSCLAAWPVSRPGATTTQHAKLTSGAILLKRIQVPVHAAEIDHALIHYWGRHDRADRRELVDCHVHVFKVAENGRVQHFLIEAAVRIQNLERISFRGGSLKLPSELAGFGVDRVEPAVVVTDIRQVACEGRRREDVRFGIEVEAQPPVLYVEGHETRAVGSADVNDSIADCGRANHPRLTGWIVPFLVSSGSVNRIHVRVAAADIDRSVNNSG